MLIVRQQNRLIQAVLLDNLPSLGSMFNTSFQNHFAGFVNEIRLTGNHLDVSVISTNALLFIWRNNFTHLTFYNLVELTWQDKFFPGGGVLVGILGGGFSKSRAHFRPKNVIFHTRF